MRAGVGGAGVRAGGTAAGPARRGPQGGRAPADGVRRPEDFDVIGLAEDALEAAVQVFHVRRGRVVGRHGFFVEKVEDLTTPQLVGRVLEQVYAEAPSGCPARCWCPSRPTTWPPTSVALRPAGGPGDGAGPRAGPQAGAAGNGPQRGGALCATGCGGPPTTRAARALEALQHALGLPEAPLRIECYDMSHLQGTDYVGSMVVFEDGLPKRSDYRHFKVAAVRQRRLRGHGGGAHPPPSAAQRHPVGRRCRERRSVRERRG